MFPHFWSLNENTEILCSIELLKLSIFTEIENFDFSKFFSVDYFKRKEKFKNVFTTFCKQTLLVYRKHVKSWHDIDLKKPLSFSNSLFLKIVILLFVHFSFYNSHQKLFWILYFTHSLTFINIQIYIWFHLELKIKNPIFQKISE